MMTEASYIVLTSLFHNLSFDHRNLPSFPTRRSSDLFEDKRRALLKNRNTIDKKSSTVFKGMQPNVTPVPKNIYEDGIEVDRKSTRLNSSHVAISYAVFCLKKKTTNRTTL